MFFPLCLASSCQEVQKQGLKEKGTVEKLVGKQLMVAGCAASAIVKQGEGLRGGS